MLPGTGMTGRSGHRTMEMNGKSTVSYLVRTPILKGLEVKGFLAFQGRRGIASVVRWNLRPVIFGPACYITSTILELTLNSLHERYIA